jgi:hypothetical protein
VALDPIKHTDAILAEASSAQKDIRAEFARNTELYKGNIWPKGKPKHEVSMVANHLKETIIRKVSLMTDVPPQLEIFPTHDSLYDSSKMLKECITGLWEQNGWSDSLQEIIYFNELNGCAYTSTIWDQDLNWGDGDINLVVGDPSAYYIDPFVTRSHKLHEGEYVGYEYYKPTEMLRQQYPKLGHLIKSDFELSAEEDKGFMSSVMKALKMKQEQGFKPAIERSKVRAWWIKDHSLNGNKEKEFPIGRFIRRVGSVILDDDPNVYWDGRFPIDMIDWQFDPDSPFGISEVHDLAGPFQAYNKVLALVLENAILNTNTIWTGDHDALPPGEREKLLSNKPGTFIGTRPGKSISRVSPPPFPSYMMEVPAVLRGIMDDLSGLNEQSRGRKGGAQSGVAIESLNMAAQSIIRYQARRLEGMLQRIGQKIIARIFQFYTDDRLIFMTGDDKEFRQFKFNRDALLKPLIELYKSETHTMDVNKTNAYIARKAFKNFRFHVVAGSSLAMTKVQRATLAMTLHKMRIIDDEAVLDMMDFPNKTTIMKRKKDKEARGEKQNNPRVAIPNNLVSDKGHSQRKMPGA